MSSLLSRSERACTRTLVVVATLLVVAPSVRAQATRPSAMLSTDVGLNSAYVWRGVTSTNRFVIDPEVELTLPLDRRARTTLALNAWANVEPARYDGPHDISTFGGLPGPLFTQSELSVELRRALGAANLSLGATRYLYPEVAGLAKDFATNELHVVATSEHGTIAPSLGVYYDVQKVRGAYVEGGASMDVGVPYRRGRTHAVTVGALVGFSAGQGVDGSHSAYFAGDGLTHADLSASTELTVGALTVVPNAHLILARDAFVRVAAPDRDRAAKLWLGATLSWETALRRRHPHGK